MATAVTDRRTANVQKLLYTEAGVVLLISSTTPALTCDTLRGSCSAVAVLLSSPGFWSWGNLTATSESLQAACNHYMVLVFLPPTQSNPITATTGELVHTRIRVESNRITPDSIRIESETKTFNLESNLFGPKQQKRYPCHSFRA